MKLTAFIGFVVWLLTAPILGAAEAQMPAEPPDLKPVAAVQKILDEAAQRIKDKQPEEALQAADRAWSVAQESKDPVGEAQAQRARALALQALNRTEEAITAWREAAAAAVSGPVAGKARCSSIALTETGLREARKPEKGDPPLSGRTGFGVVPDYNLLASELSTF